MRLSYLFTIAAVLSLLYGLGFVILPEQLLSIYGIPTDAGGLLFARLFGAALTGLGVLTWLIRSADAWDALRAVLLGLVAFNMISVVVLLLAQIDGTVNALGWINVAIFLLLALGFGYFLMPRSGSEQTSTPGA
jgi:hypothetical protein